MNLKGLDYEVDPITPFYGNAEFERLSPLRRIPVLIDGDFTLSDSSVICAYLDEAYPGHALFPADPKERARARWFEEYADTRLGDAFHLGIVLPEDRPSGRSGASPATKSGSKSRSSEDIPAALDYLEGVLPADGFLFGEMGVADISIASFFRNGAYAGFEADAERWPRTAGFVERTLAQPCVADLLKFEDVQRSAEIKGRRQALLDAGAPLTAETMGVREPRRGMMRL